MQNKKPKRVFAMGGGGIGCHEDIATVIWLLKSTGKACPKICYIPTACGDSHEAVQDFFEYMRLFECEPSYLELFSPLDDDIDTYAHDLITSQDIVFVEGGNTANMLAIWRVHGVDKALKEAYEKGVVMSGLSAGSLCWFEGGTTDSFGRKLRAINDGLGILKGSNCPHYNGEAQRRPLYHKLIKEGTLSPGIAADEGVGLHFIDGVFKEAITCRGQRSKAYQVKLNDEGEIQETAIPAHQVENELNLWLRERRNIRKNEILRDESEAEGLFSKKELR
ncbi:peptidase E [Patescibacteria group bacterium]|nr:peptidase E [Patescibacteria group bacterium]